MKTAISLPDELFDVAERAAKRLGMSRSELYRRALTAFLESRDDGWVTEELNEVYSDTRGEGDLAAGFQELQALSVAPDEW